MRRVFLFGFANMIGLGLAWLFRASPPAALGAAFIGFFAFHIAYRLLSGRWRY